MVSYTPIEPRASTAQDRAWALRRLDFMRALIESGAAFATEDGAYNAVVDGKRIASSAFVFYDADWIAAHKERVAAETRKPPASC
jgi:hypothetical protein